MIFIETSQTKKPKEFIAVHHITRFRKDTTGKVFNLNMWMGDSSETVSFSTQDERDRYFLGIEELILTEQRGYFIWDMNEKVFKRLTNIL